MLKNISTLVLLLVAINGIAADFNVPTVSRCLADLEESNTNDSKVYNIYSDFYYEYDDKRDYAIAAIKKLAKTYSSQSSSCASFTQPMNRSTVKCEKVAGSDVCIIPSDAGEFIVVKDYVDSTNVVLVEYSDQYSEYPTINSENDFENLWLPQPDLCYEGLLKPIYDSQAHENNSELFKEFDDLRFLLARSNRDLVKRLAESSYSCSYQTFAVATKEMECLQRDNKPTICGVRSTNGGYFVYITDADFDVHMVFNRWD
ncbi:MAG: hypothetical protein HWE27_03385 [Gammaproteobacteria bacterium]|nr:hypothetical protein [Gammaproteobacteria bacterium]